MSHLITYKTKLIEVINFLRFIRFVKVNKNENVLIYGISRGGTTLLAETLVQLFKARLVWEPLFVFKDVKFQWLNPFSVKEYKTLGFGWSPHTSRKNEKSINQYFDRLFNLDIRNIRYLRFTNYKDFKKSEYSIFKFCFANFMYPYFQQRYGQKSIILLRHPFAIAASSLNFGENFDWHKKNYENWSYKDSEYSDSFFSTYSDNYYLINSPFTLLVFQAVTQFSYCLKHFDKTNSIIMYYEDIVLNPDDVFKQLQSFFNASLNYDLFLQQTKKQSFSSQKGHTEKEPLKQLSKWKSKVPEDEIKNAMLIFKAFNFNAYNEGIVPVKNQ